MLLIGKYRTHFWIALLGFVMAVTGCGGNQSLRNINNVHGYQSFLLRQGEIPSCGFSKEAITFFTGMGGDSVILSRGKPVNIYDVGDVETGPTLETHDRIIIQSAKPEQITFSRKGSALVICSEERSVSAAILRQYCSEPGGDNPWNNSIEEITFSSGETWLSDELFHAQQVQGGYVTRELLGSYKISNLSEEEFGRWKVRPLSEMIPAPGKARKHCNAARKTFIEYGYDPDEKNPLKNFGLEE